MAGILLPSPVTLRSWLQLINVGDSNRNRKICLDMFEHVSTCVRLDKNVLRTADTRRNNVCNITV